jgi:hypothetical protein
LRKDDNGCIPGHHSADDPFDALFEHADIEIDEQSEMQVGKLQIRQQLAVVDGQEPVYRFEFENDMPLNEQVETQSIFDADALIDERNQRLCLKSDTSLAKFYAEAGLLNRLKQAGTQGLVYLERGIHEDSGKFFDILR